jgi:hypothetical protein
MGVRIMLIDYKPEDFESFAEVNICEYHKKHPNDRSYAGCTCSAVFGQRMKKKEILPPDLTLRVIDKDSWQDKLLYFIEHRIEIGKIYKVTIEEDK